jgi:hypothetical protein
MSSSNHEEALNNKAYTYLDSILILLCDIYKCPCDTCIEANTERIQSMLPTIQEFYYFLINYKKFIHQNDYYLKKIKELIPNMITFNNVILQDKVCMNTQLGVSVIYSENDNTEDQFYTSKNATFTLAKLFQYYPEMRVEFM